MALAMGTLETVAKGTAPEGDGWTKKKKKKRSMGAKKKERKKEIRGLRRSVNEGLIKALIGRTSHLPSLCLIGESWDKNARFIMATFASPPVYCDLAKAPGDLARPLCFNNNTSEERS